MTDTLFQTLKKQLLLILPHLNETDITTQDSLKDLGANSMDRAEIIIETLRALNLNIPMVQFGQAKNIADIVAVIETTMTEPTDVTP